MLVLGSRFPEVQALLDARQVVETLKAKGGALEEDLAEEVSAAQQRLERQKAEMELQRKEMEEEIAAHRRAQDQLAGQKRPRDES